MAAGHQSTVQYSYITLKTFNGCLQFDQNVVEKLLLIGASLSEPYTSVTALLDACVCICLSVCGHIPKT